MMTLAIIVEETLDQMICSQREKVLKIANDILPNVTPEDIRNPQDFPALYKDALFNYEDGILTGYISTQIALRNKLRENI